MSPYAPIPLAGSHLGQHRHVCAFFNTPDEEYRVMFPFIRDAIELGERCVSIVPDARTDYLDRLRNAGVDVDAARGKRQLEVVSTEVAYTFEGRIDVEAMLERVLAAMEEGLALGFPLTRLHGHGESALINPQNVDSFLEYESRLTGVVARTPGPLVCVYDLNRISAGVAYDVLRTHPMTIIGGVLQENPFFEPPESYLQELRGRRMSAERTALPPGAPGEESRVEGASVAPLRYPTSRSTVH
jgi:hypothetical protein